MQERYGVPKELASRVPAVAARVAAPIVLLQERGDPPKDALCDGLLCEAQT